MTRSNPSRQQTYAAGKARNDFRERLREALAAGGREHGTCEICMAGHAYPDVRWRCECGRVLCWREARDGCECGGGVTLQPPPPGAAHD